MEEFFREQIANEFLKTIPNMNEIFAYVRAHAELNQMNDDKWDVFEEWMDHFLTGGVLDRHRLNDLMSRAGIALTRKEDKTPNENLLFAYVHYYYHVSTPLVTDSYTYFMSLKNLGVTRGMHGMAKIVLGFKNPYINLTLDLPSPEQQVTVDTLKNLDHLEMWRHGATVLKDRTCMIWLANKLLNLSYGPCTLDDGTSTLQIRDWVLCREAVELFKLAYSLGNLKSGRILIALQNLHPDPVAPFGQWAPCKKVQKWVPKNVESEMIHFLILRKKKLLGTELPKDLVNLLLWYICTRR